MNFAALEREYGDKLKSQFAAVFDSTPNPSGAKPTREALDERSCPGLDSIDCTDALIGNADLPLTEHVPTVIEPGMAPLPGHEHQMNHGGLS